MEATKNDLSYNSTKLDYLALVRTSKIAFAHTRNELDRYLNQTHEIKPCFSYSHLARIIKEEADQLIIAAEVMDTLEGGLSREKLEVVNKPEVEKETE